MVETGYSDRDAWRSPMDALLPAAIVVTLLALLALAGAAESRDGFDRTDPDRSAGR